MADDNELPEFDYDPTGNLDARVRRFEQQAGMSQLASAITNAEQEFMQEHEDYHDALEHLRKHTIKGYTRDGLPETVARQHLYRDELRTAAEVMRQGRNPAQFAYELAKEKGYGQTDEFDQVLGEIFGKEMAARMKDEV